MSSAVLTTEFSDNFVSLALAPLCFNAQLRYDQIIALVFVVGTIVLVWMLRNYVSEGRHPFTKAVFRTVVLLLLIGHAAIAAADGVMNYLLMYVMAMFVIGLLWMIKITVQATYQIFTD